MPTAPSERARPLPFTGLCVAAAWLLAGCGASATSDAAALGPTGSPEAAAPCEVAGTEGVTAIHASEYGLALASPSGDGLVVQRRSGSACALTPDGGRPVAAGALLDLDDHGTLYVFPAAAPSPDVVSTWLEDGGADGVVESVDEAGLVSPVVHAGRGIWAFGVSPGGESFWVTACGPTGIFAGREPDLTTTLAPPDTLWDAQPSVLTDPHTLWSVGFRTCSASEPTSPSCGFALTRTTPEGSEERGTTVMDFGAGFEQAVLTRCGAEVCGGFPGAVVRWNEAGERIQTVTPADLGAAAGARFLDVTGSREGLYVLLEEPTGTRVMYAPRAQDP